MSNYTESKKRIDSIRSKYSSAGDIIFRSAIDTLIDVGKDYLSDESSYEHMINFTDNELDITVLKCAHELADINTTDLLVYIQKELYLSNDGGMSYQTMARKLSGCIEWIIGDADCSDVVKDLKYGVGFSENELRSLGYDYLFDVIDE